MIRKEHLIKIARRSVSNKIQTDLFGIPLEYTSSIHLMIDRDILYLGEIYASETVRDEVALSLVCDETSRILLLRQAFHHLPFLVKNKDVYCVEAFANIKNYEAISKHIWELELTLTQTGKVVKI